MEVSATVKPHSVPDLYLAPVVLELDERLEELGALSPGDLATRVELASNTPGTRVEWRADGLLRTIEQFVDLHDWTLSWDARGLRVSHGKHHVVLGLPETLRTFAERP